ncbi:CrcB family protein [Psychrobacillus sp. FJAT-51614]|uniref:Fluoride-specific ion channel FluC n=1 Tax=Psychrobacillus mangrovi TaxID=3117745 RepID=A0ABU8F2V3_9BACI
MSIFYLGVVAIGGFLGSIVRFYISQKLNNQERKLPLGTLLVNLSGSFLLGYSIHFGLDKYSTLLFGVGLLGAFTTFSTFNSELLTLQKYPRKWLIYFAATYIGGIGLAFLGFYIGK